MSYNGQSSIYTYPPRILLEFTENQHFALVDSSPQYLEEFDLVLMDLRS